MDASKHAAMRQSASLTKLGIEAVQKVMDGIEVSITDPRHAFVRYPSVGRGKGALLVDLTAEEEMYRHIFEALPHIVFTGEERLEAHADYSGKEGTYVVADAVDGTDLLCHGIPAWASVLVFFEPKTEHIVQSCVVGIPATGSAVRYIVFADATGDVGIQEEGTRRPLRGPPKKRPLEHATVSYYGQRPAFTAAMIETGFFEELNQPKYADTRVLNLGGIPMLVRMVNALDGDRQIDAVIEAHGAYPHDAVAGLYIALKGGATVLSLEPAKWGTPLTVEKLGEMVLRPSRSTAVKYLAAAHEDLAHQILEVLKVPETR